MPPKLQLIDKQKSFIYKKKNARFRLALAGVQGGKTESGCIFMAHRFAESKNKIFMVVAPTYTMLHQTTLPKLREVLKRMHPQWIIKEESRYEKKWVDRNNNTIYWRSADHPDSLRGPTLTGGFFFDEAAIVPTSQPWRILYQRVSATKGFGILTTTPKGANWLLREIIRPWQKGDKRYHFVKWRSVDNPVFDKQMYYDALKYQDVRWVKQEYDAEMQDFGGLVFPEFDDTIHTDTLLYDENLPVYWGVDFGIANPTYIGFYQVDPSYGSSGRVLQLDELQLRDMKFPEVLVEALKKPYKKPDWACCDPSGRFREKIAGIGTIQTMIEAGIPVVYQSNWNVDYVRFQGIQHNYKLLKETDPEDGKPMIIHDEHNCWNMIQAYGMYARKTNPDGGRAEEKPLKDGISDHCMEAQFYFLMGRPHIDNNLDLIAMEQRRQELEMDPVDESTGF